MSTQKHRKRNKKKESFIVMLFFMAIALVVSTTFLILLSVQKRTLINDGVEAQAIVTEKRLNIGHKGPSMPTISYSFTTKDNQTIHTERQYIPSNLKQQFQENELFSVTYLESYPDKNEPTRTLHTLWYFYVFFPLYFVALAGIARFVFWSIKAILEHPRVTRAKKTWFGGFIYVISYLAVFVLCAVIAVNGVAMIVQLLESAILPQ